MLPVLHVPFESLANFKEAAREFKLDVRYFNVLEGVFLYTFLETENGDQWMDIDELLGHGGLKISFHTFEQEDTLLRYYEKCYGAEKVHEEYADRDHVNLVAERNYTHVVKSKLFR